MTSCWICATSGCCRVISAIASRTVAPAGRSSRICPTPAASRYDAKRRIRTFIEVNGTCENSSRMDPSGAVPAILITFVLILLNGFFVAAEYAFVRVLKTQLEEAVEAGSARARLARRIEGRLETYISA